MLQNANLLPIANRLDAKTITAGAAADVTIAAEARLARIQSIAGDTYVNARGTVAITDGDWDVFIPEGATVDLAIDINTTLSVLGAGEVKISTFG